MVCDACQTNPATVYLTQIVEGKMQKVNLCDLCAKAKKVLDPTGFQLADLLLGLGVNTELEKPQVETAPAPVEVAMLKCPACGFTQADFKKTQRMGCSECYETFADSIMAPLRSNHKGSEHIGKLPARQFRRVEAQRRMGALQSDLAKAVKQEDYEGAAQIRDAIRQLESQLNAPRAA
ncbi:MAG: UvrB/UvrC motif-containing protein [Verrucomicrobia bacterium]|nr:UvrB/UvrC motif-containing protein [Verrucomicrobiota bacterium]